MIEAEDDALVGVRGGDDGDAPEPASSVFTSGIRLLILSSCPPLAATRNSSFRASFGFGKETSSMSTAGVFPYYCQFHGAGGMSGVVYVE